MRLQVHRPNASAIVASLRSIGYSFSTALADLIDNSISAGAKNVDIGFRTQPEPYVAILDDGCGMSYEELLNAMRHGGEGPSQARHSADLGRFGLGLKTASLSQCRQLTVVTLKAAVLSASRWDLDVVEQHGDWTLQILDDAEIAPLPRLVELLAQESGTIVLWRDLDRALEGSLQPDAGLSRLIDDSREHLALVFHRYINPTPTESGCAISINS